MRDDFKTAAPHLSGSVERPHARVQLAIVPAAAKLQMLCNRLARDLVALSEAEIGPPLLR